MEEIKQLESILNQAKAQLKQLRTSDHFTKEDIELLEPNLVLLVEKLQKKYENNLKLSNE